MVAVRPAQTFALVGGIAYLVIGVAGFFVTGFGDIVGEGGSLLGFSVNVFHNFIHIGIGVLLLLASRGPVPGITEGVLIGGGFVLILAAFLGFTNNLELLAVEGPGDPDNFLHAITGAAAIFFGLTGGPAVTRSREAG